MIEIYKFFSVYFKWDLKKCKTEICESFIKSLGVFEEEEERTFSSSFLSDRRKFFTLNVNNWPATKIFCFLLNSWKPTSEWTLMWKSSKKFSLIFSFWIERFFKGFFCKTKILHSIFLFWKIQFLIFSLIKPKESEKIF